MTPPIYPTVIRIRKARLLPRVVRARYALRIEIGQERPKQMTIAASRISDMFHFLLFCSPAGQDPPFGQMCIRDRLRTRKHAARSSPTILDAAWAKTKGAILYGSPRGFEPALRQNRMARLLFPCPDPAFQRSSLFLQQKALCFCCAPR